MKPRNDLVLTDPGIKRYNSMRELPDASYPYKFDESDEEEENHQVSKDDEFLKQDN